ncbi:MAG: outer membrane protein transport protein [Bacteroidota bacterium]
MLFNRNILGLAAVASMAMSPVAFATNGYFLPGFGIRSMGMGGVGIASGADAISAAANPANLSKVGKRMDVGVTIFNPERSSEVWDDPSNGANPFQFSGGGDSKHRFFPMPEFGMSRVYNSDITFGFAAVGNGGMNTTYKGDNFFNYKLLSTPGQDTTVGVDLIQLLMPLSASFKVSETQSVGASVVFAVQRFGARGLGAFPLFDGSFPITADPNHLTNKGFDWSYGAGMKLGWLGDFFDKKLTVGAAYGTKTYMTNFDKYKGLFAEQGDFDIPENFGIGLAIRPNDQLTVALDVTRIMYSNVASVGNPGMNGVPGIGGVPSISDATYELGNDEGMGFGWSDQTIYKLGVEYMMNDKLTLRAGYNYGKSPVADDQLTFNTLAPAVVEKHYSVGFTYKMRKDLEISGNYMHAASHTQQACGQNIVDCVKIGMHQNYLGLSASWLY